MRILVVEDNASTARALELMLTTAKHGVFMTGTGEEGIDLAKNYEYDLIILDLDLPDMNGMDVLRHLRIAKINTPILILTGSDDTESKLRGFGFGADDYMTKPFNHKELQARIQAIIRRSKGHSQAMVELGDLTINLDTRTAEIRGKELKLTGKEYQILELLSLRRGNVIAKEAFLNHLYGGIEEPEAKIVDVFVCKLRKKLSDAMNGQNMIETVWGRGYVLREPQPATQITARA